MDDEPITTVRAFLHRSGNFTNDDVDAARRLVEALADDPEPDAVMTAVAAWRRIAAATPHDDPTRAARMSGLSQAMRVSFELIGRVDDLDDAVAAAADAVEAADADDPSLANYCANLAVVLRLRYDRNGDPADLDAAIDSVRRAVAKLPKDDQKHVVWLRNLAANLRMRLSTADEPRPDLDRLIEVSGQIVGALPRDDPARGHSLAEHAEDLFIRFQMAGDPADGDAAVDLLRQAVEATPRDDPSRPGLLAKLAGVALMRYQSGRDLDCLDLSIASSREALDAAPDGDPGRAGTLANLGVALRNRFERTEVPADIDAAIEFSERAVALFAPDDTDRAAAAFNLGAAQHIRYQHRHAPADLDAALANLRRAVDAAPLGHPSHVMAWSSLGLALRSQFERTGDLADLDAAVEAGQRALADLPADATDRAMYQANLDGTLIVRLRHSDAGDPAGLAGLADRFASWAAGAEQVAAEDPERGLAMIDELIDFCGGIPALATGAAELRYNRAAVLRMLGRREEAEAGYREVVDDFASHPDPDVAFWAALALYNTITLVMETSEPEAAAERVPALVTRLREQSAGHDHPLVARRVRAAIRIEAQLFESLGRIEQAAESMAQLHALLRPALDQVLGRLAAADPTEAVDDVTPRFAMEREALVIPLLDELDECIDVVRELADAPHENLIELVGAQHRLLSMAAIQMLTAVKDGVIPAAEGEEDRDRIERGMRVLGSVYQYLVDRPGEYPLESGPIETLPGAVDASIAMPDALEVARSAKLVGALSVPYVNALVEQGAMQLLRDGQWQQAARLQLLVLAAAERQPNSGEGRAIVTSARYRWLYVARQVLVKVPNGRVLHSARDAGERVLRALEPSADPGQLADVLIALAALHIDPQSDLYTGSDEHTLNVAGYRRWLDRAGEYVLDPVEVPDEVGVAMPDPTETLGTGEKYLRRALTLAEPSQRGRALMMLLNIHDLRTVLGVDTGGERRADLVASAVASIDAEAYPDLMAQALLAQLSGGGQPDQAAIDRLLSRSIAEVAERVGTEAATGTLIGAGQLLRSTDPARGRRLLAGAEEFIRGLPERARAKVLMVQQELLTDPSDLEDGEPDSAADPKDASLALLKRAKAAGWPNDRTALALLALTGRGSVRTDESARQLAWLTNLKVIPQLFADVFAGQADALAFLTASWYTQASGRAHERADWEHALRTQAAACAEYLALPIRDAAMESLTLMALAVKAAGGAGLATATASALGPLVVRAENLIGTAATEVLQQIWSQVIGAVRSADQAPELFACVQLAKGARFADALCSGIRFDARADEPSTRLLELIGQLGDEADKDLDLDSVTLVTPYTERLDAGDMSLARQRENLQRTFDASVQRHLTGEQVPRLLSIDTLRDLLPTDTVLLCTYLSHSPDGGRSMLSLVATKDRLAVVPNKVLAADEANELTGVRFGDRIRMLDGLGLVAHRIRYAVLAEPGPVRPVAGTEEAALADGLPGLFGPVTDLLREEYAAGRRHLVIVPHAGLHFAPLHLLYLGGGPIADTWSVSYLPSIALLERTGAARGGERTLASVGLGFAGGQLPPIPEAVEEAVAVAAEFGTTALLDEHATEEAVFAALGSARLFHIATHGEHNVAAPAFQCLYVADERVSAHELLRLDLSGLELVTLSACETALGRFDAADNLRGIPASLLLRGASAIVGTLWAVETRTSRDFFTTLYRELHRGRSRLDAFTEAQHRTRAVHPQYRDWGAFYYTGDWR